MFVSVPKNRLQVAARHQTNFESPNAMPVVHGRIKMKGPFDSTSDVIGAEKAPKTPRGFLAS